MKIIMIGSPGAGKSVLAKRLKDILNYQTLHLDKIYHTKGKSHISREELVNKVNEFSSEYSNWIIDGNYISTLEMRVRLSDTIILFNISPDICVSNVYKRYEECKSNNKNKEDMSKDFDMILSDDFISYIKDFQKYSITMIKDILCKYEDKKIYEITDYEELEEMIKYITKDN